MEVDAMSEEKTTTRKKSGRKPKNAAALPVEPEKAEEVQTAPAPEGGEGKEDQAPPGVTDDNPGGDEEAEEQAPPENGGGDPPQQDAEGWAVARVLKVTKPLMQGEDVKALQAALIARGYHCGAGGASGVYERFTAYAVRCFQSANRLIVDGKAGRFTVSALGGTWKG